MMGSNGLILGTFPVYECTDPNHPIKQQKGKAEGTVRFFYGSVDSEFWNLYHDHIDTSIKRFPVISEQLLLSLKQNGIAISDTISSCERYEYKSGDGDLRSIVYNVDGIKELIRNGVRRILCTSKKVLNDHLDKQIISKGKNPFGYVDADLSIKCQTDFIHRIGGNQSRVKKPIMKVFRVDNYQIIALAIPSPGSAQRKLDTFGFDKTSDWKRYAEEYYANAFSWLARS